MEDVTPLRIAVQGCAHGELDKIYAAIGELNSRFEDGRGVDLLLCCGDFQAVRNEPDLECMACPPKYRAMRDFWAYYAGLKQAPVLTIVVGGNHEASNYMQELPYGGWLAPNIYYLGTSGCVRYRGVRIAGYSGIYKRYDWGSGYWECAPYSDDALRSVNHTRAHDLYKLALLRDTGPVDLFMSHDWPAGITSHGDEASLLRRKGHFAEDIAWGELGNPHAMDLLHLLRPRYWFSGHLHCKFGALLPHGTAGSGSSPSCTRFLATDKPLPGRPFLQVLDVPLSATAHSSTTTAAAAGLEYDPAWVAILARTHWSVPTGRRAPPYPLPAAHLGACAGVGGGTGTGAGHAAAGRSQVEAPSLEEQQAVMSKLARAFGSLPSTDSSSLPRSARMEGPLARVHIPLNFTPTVPAWVPPPAALGHREGPGGYYRQGPPPPGLGNPQMDAFLSACGLQHMHTLPCPGSHVPMATLATQAPPPMATTGGGLSLVPGQVQPGPGQGGRGGGAGTVDDLRASAAIAKDDNEIDLDL